jgi:hypothetical protein
MLRIAPAPDCSRKGVAAKVARTVAKRSTARLPPQPASSSVVAKAEALLTRMSMPPSASAAPAMYRSIWSFSARSQGAACAFCPWAAMSARVFSSASAPRAQIDTEAPASAQASAIARPMPRLAPQMTARLPLRSMFMTPQPRSDETMARSCVLPPGCASR